MTLGPYYRFVIEVDIVVKASKEVVISLKPVAKVPHTSPFKFRTIYSFLIGCSTELFYIETSFKDEMTIVEVRLFKLDMTGMMWQELEDLKDATFFLDLSSYSVFYKSAVGSQIGGCVHVLGLKNKIISLEQCLYLQCRICQEKARLLEANCHKIVIRSVSRDEAEFDNTRSESHLLNVPFDILQMVSERFSHAEIQSFRATCKRCYLATPLWRPQMYSPWLLVLNIHRGTLTFIDPICGNEYIKKTPLKLKGDYQILCSRYGWLLMSKLYGWELVFFNPFIGKICTLPKVACSFESICFSAPPTSPDCMVVGFATYEPFHVYIHFVSRKLPSWQGYRLDFGTHAPYSFHLPIFSGRDIYALCNNRKIAIFRNIGKEDFYWEVVKDKALRSCCKHRSKLYLSKCDQHLLLVIVSDVGTSIEVFKLNDSTKEWEKIDSLGAHMIYISGSSCICLEAKLPQTRNTIYFPRLLRKSHVFYSLETCRYHTFNSKIIQESFGANLHGTMHHCDPLTWIENGGF
ncbi:F-box/kelch-repeat protein At1g57790-like [Bidens hawaiensis]|uniref:F-box/kelch-repeat protein At1g57790-like n=1 Tax=Bidens hawaiensis TaxID=980011 RepID=UPI00404B6A03